MDIEKAKKIIEEVFGLLGTSVDSIAHSFHEKRGHVFSVRSKEFEKAYQDRPDFTKDLVYLLKKIFDKNIFSGEEVSKCTIDINDLQSKADDRIKIKALNAAEEARSLKTDVVLDPMSSYERMVVHSTLADQADITTESVGEGKDRKVKVKYLPI